jgi:SHS2 domain-containing protein
MKKFEVLDISGDVGLRVSGTTVDELFEVAASGMSALITDPSKITSIEKREITVKNNTLEDLLVLWLNELIFLFDTYGYIGNLFSVDIKNTILSARVSGSIFNPEVNEKRLLLKAATYHKLSLKKDSIWKATIIFDI